MSKRGFDKLRTKAEEKLAQIDLKTADMGRSDLKSLAHELAVHQIELEIQNEELRQSRMAVEEVRDRYLDLFDFAPVGYFTLDGHSRIIEANLTGCRLLGMDRRSLKNKPFTRFMAENETDNFYLYRKNVLESDSQQKFTLKMKKADGSSFYAQLDGIKTSEGILRIAINDISERKHAEEQLFQRAEELETVMNVVPVAIWVAHDPACHNITGNQTANRFYEAKVGENVSAGPAIGEPVPERRFFRNGKELTAEQLPMQEAAARNVDIQGSEFNVLLPSGKSRILWGSASPLRNDDGQVRGVVAAFVDITERTQEQQKLKESEDRFSKAFHSSPVGLSISRINDGTFIDINQSFVNMFGYKREELIGHKATEFNIYDNPIDRKEIVRHLEQQGKVLNYEVTARTKAGTEINALTSAEKIEINGQTRIIWTTIDITERKKTEKEVLRLNRELRAINECDQVLSHSNDEQTILSEVCRILCQTAGYRMAWVASVEHDEAKSVRPLAWCGDQEYITNARITWADNNRGRGPTGAAARNNKTYFFQDFAAEPAAAPWRDAAMSRGYRSSIAIPLTDFDGGVWGVFTLYSAEPNYFDSAEIKLLEMLAGDISFGINGLREREKRKNAETEIAHLASFPEFNPNPIIEFDFSGNVKYANPAAKRDFPLMFRGKKPTFLMDLFNAIQKDKTHSITKDVAIGSLWYEQVLVYVQSTTSYLLYGRDITARKIAEESLRKSEEKYRTLNLTMSEGVCLHELIYDGSGKAMDYRILDINPAYEQFTGLTKEQAVGKKASELYGTGNPPYFDLYKRVAESGKPESFETYFPPMKKYFSISAFSPGKGNFATVFTDITLRKQTEDELRQRAAALEAANKELETFSYSVSHDLRAPLRSITGFSNVLLEDYNDKLDQEGKSYLKKISDSGDLMGQLMDDLLKLSRVTRSDLSMEKLDLSEMARKIINDLAEDEPNRKVKVTIAPNIVAHGDKNLLNLALQNLLGNAWKYSSKTAESQIEMGTVEHKGKTAYFIRDNGVGFDMTYANKLFQPFQRLHKATEFPGTGIGLATVQRIIRRHGGEVWAESKVGEGATFYFTLELKT